MPLNGDVDVYILVVYSIVYEECIGSRRWCSRFEFEWKWF
jgi:hypothetical protein